MTSQTCWRTEAAWPWENETLAQALEESPGSSRHGRPPGALRQRALGHAVYGALDREDCGLDGALDGAQGRVGRLIMPYKAGRHGRVQPAAPVGVFVMHHANRHAARCALCTAQQVIHDDRLQACIYIYDDRIACRSARLTSPSASASQCVKRARVKASLRTSSPTYTGQPLIHGVAASRT